MLLDVEGTLVADKRYQPVGGAVDFIRQVRALGLPFRLITNNTTDSIPALAAKLARAGFDFTVGELHTCIGAACTHLHGRKAKRCLILGGTGLRRMFDEQGFEVVEASDVDFTRRIISLP